MDKEFRQWYDEHGGPEAYAYDVWVAAWKAAKKPNWTTDTPVPPFKYLNLQEAKPVMCFCENIQRCTIFDRCMRNEKD